MLEKGNKWLMNLITKLRPWKGNLLTFWQPLAFLKTIFNQQPASQICGLSERRVMDKTGITHNLMLTIDQISQLTGVRKSTLRYWEKSFDHFLRPARTHSNRREYTMEDLDRVKAIQHLLEQEHLTAYGVRMRLNELFPSKGEREGERKARTKTVKRPASSRAGNDSSV
jgi:DNA-binding transcriptional MerR regulator